MTVELCCRTLSNVEPVVACRREADTENSYSVSGNRSYTVTLATCSCHTASVCHRVVAFRPRGAYLHDK